MLTPQILLFSCHNSSSVCDSYNKIMYRSGGIYTLKKMEEEIDLYFFRCYDEDKYDQRRVKMKKILASLMMVGLIFVLVDATFHG